MGKSTAPTADRAAMLIDEIGSANRVLWCSQARQAALMVQFCDARKAADKQLIADRRSTGADPMFKAGEFAANEVSLAVKTSKFVTQRTIAMTRRVQTDAPDAWDAWEHGDIDQDKVVRINRALRRLVHDRSKELLNTLVVPVAIEKTPEILGRWLNQFIAEVEPDETDERLRRSYEDRYVSVRPDIDGISFLHAALSSVDAVAVDQILNALASVSEPGDDRTKQQRRADALVDLLCGRVSNGWHTGFDTNSDTDDHLDDDTPTEALPAEELSADNLPADDHLNVGMPAHQIPTDEMPAVEVPAAEMPAAEVPAVEMPYADDLPAGQTSADDWDLPATAFRPDPHAPAPDASGQQPVQPTDTGADSGAAPINATPARISTPPPAAQPRPPAVTIGVVVTAQSLFGYSTMPGQLADRSSLVPADTIRDLAQQPGTLFYRLLTDDTGKLLDVTEMGRFPSRKLDTAVKFRTGICGQPSCHQPADRCDLDHLIPVPEGATTGTNLAPACRHDHRSKTHAGHSTERTGPGTTRWTTPTGHTYRTEDQPFPIDHWPESARGTRR